MNKIVIIGLVIIALSFTAGLASSGFNFAEAAGGWKPAVDALFAQITGLGDRTSELEGEVFCSGNGTYDSGTGTCACDGEFTGLDCSGTGSVCSNGIVEGGEDCDDGNIVTEVCDYGQTSCTVCASNCIEQAGDTSFCGDNNTDLDNGEVCDDGNTSDGDGCSATCTSDETCGNGVVDSAVGETCDDGNISDGDGCSATCTSDETCGNGVVDSVVGEVCDDGNTVDGDGCSSACLLEVVNCDDSNPCTVDFFDAQAQQCVNDTAAANGFACDDGQFCTGTDVCQSGACVGSGDPCAGNVGDNDTDCSESCDEGANSCTANDPVFSFCSLGFCDGDDLCLASVCGNGIVEPGEACDDGNTVPDDDCTNSCTLGGGGG